MRVRLEKTFPIDAPASAAWRLLRDIKGVAECMPGAQITERIDDAHYIGQVNVKLGPASATFKGTIEVKSVDASKQQIQILGKGADVTGASAANMDLTAHIRQTADGKCEVVGVSEVTVSGKMANFGGRMMTQVSDQILKQFGVNFANRVLAMGEGAAAEKAAATVAAQPKELNGLVLLWQVIVGFFKALFGGNKSNTVG
jgi:carbon monoxide dehydrogenase subunit G